MKQDDMVLGNLVNEDHNSLFARWVKINQKPGEPWAFAQSRLLQPYIRWVLSHRKFRETWVDAGKRMFRHLMNPKVESHPILDKLETGCVYLLAYFLLALIAILHLYALRFLIMFLIGRYG